MSNTEIEKRLADLEAEVALLKSKLEKNGSKDETPWWKQRIGMFADNPAYDEAMRLGREYRESQKMVYDEDED
jgi:hypothetical protein